jgi:hypothetical protein
MTIISLYYFFSFLIFDLFFSFLFFLFPSISYFFLLIFPSPFTRLVHSPSFFLIDSPHPAEWEQQARVAEVEL